MLGRVKKSNYDHKQAMNRYSNEQILPHNYHQGLMNNDSMKVIQMQGGQKFAITTTFMQIQDDNQSFLRVRDYIVMNAFLVEKSLSV